MITKASTNLVSAGPAPEIDKVVLGALLCLTGAVVLWLLPKVRVDQRPLLRGVAMMQLSLGAVLLSILGGLLPQR